jgi:hypothetical protein
MPTENLEHCNSGHLCLSLPNNLDASLLIPARIANQNNDRYEILHSKCVLKVRKSTLARQPNSGEMKERSRLIQPRFHHVMENRTCRPQPPRSGSPTHSNSCNRNHYQRPPIAARARPQESNHVATRPPEAIAALGKPPAIRAGVGRPLRRMHASMGGPTSRPGRRARRPRVLPVAVRPADAGVRMVAGNA